MSTVDVSELAADHARAWRDAATNEQRENRSKIYQTWLMSLSGPDRDAAIAAYNVALYPTSVRVSDAATAVAAEHGDVFRTATTDEQRQHVSEIYWTWLATLPTT